MDIKIWKPPPKLGYKEGARTINDVKNCFGGLNRMLFLIIKKMKETEFKTLMYCGQYVNVNLLEKGIYACSKPFIYAKDETIETLVERGRMMKDMTGAGFISEKYFDCLKQCQLVKIELIIKNE